MTEIGFFDYPALYRRFRQDFDQTFRDVCARGHFILGPDLETFEQELAARLGVHHAIGVADGTNAIALGLRAAGVGPGDEIIMSAHTYVATANAALLIGAVPVAVDIGRDGLISPAAAEAAVTGKTRAILATQLNGRVGDMEALSDLCRRFGLQLFEDAAQGMGARLNGRAAGTIGRFGTLSFYPAKSMGCFGDGGAVLTNDSALAERVRQARDHGRDADGTFVSQGTNCRLDNLQAAFLRIRLRNFDQDVERRRALAARYVEGLRDLDQVACPPGPDDGAHFDVYQNFEALFDRRDALQDHLAQRGIGTAIQWGGQTLDKIAALGIRHGALPETTDYFRRCLMLPMHMALTDQQVDRVISEIRAFYRGAS